MTETELSLEYVERSTIYELPDALEQVLEDDYIRNFNLYTDDTFKYIKLNYSLLPQLSATELIEGSREYWNESEN